MVTGRLAAISSARSGPLRPYRRARNLEWASQELDRFAGRQSDPELVRLFVHLLREEPALAAQVLDQQPSAAPVWRIDPVRRH